MLPVNATVYFEYLCTDEFAKLWIRLGDAQRDFDKKEMNGRGQGYAARLAALYHDQLRARAQVIVEAAKTIHERFDLGSDEAVEAEMAALVERTLQGQIGGLRGAYQRHLQSFGITTVPDLFANEGPLACAGVVNANRRYFWTLRSVPIRKEPGQAPIMTFNGPVGAVQTGEKSVANITQSWSNENVDAVAKALAEFRVLLQATPDINAGLRDDLVKDVENASAELVSSAPDTGRLTRWLGGVGATVQTTASLQPAWDTVKTSLRALGLPF